jgi:hypothetical protein
MTRFPFNGDTSHKVEVATVVANLLKWSGIPPSERESLWLNFYAPALMALSAFTAVAQQWSATAMTSASETDNDTGARHASTASMT